MWRGRHSPPETCFPEEVAQVCLSICPRPLQPGEPLIVTLTLTAYPERVTHLYNSCASRPGRSRSATHYHLPLGAIPHPPASLSLSCVQPVSEHDVLPKIRLEENGGVLVKALRWRYTRRSILWCLIYVIKIRPLDSREGGVGHVRVSDTLLFWPSSPFPGSVLYNQIAWICRNDDFSTLASIQRSSLLPALFEVSSFWLHLLHRLSAIQV